MASNKKYFQTSKTKLVKLFSIMHCSFDITICDKLVCRTLWFDSYKRTSISQWISIWPNYL